ncbi:MAG: beta-ketoacyl-ACP reductase [Desulfotalea sp.]|nr:MAG: beta-ketoacyl-ACP reductase [Desulfotalea sp.]
MEDFTEQIILITGATRGIGKAIAETFLKAGGTVIGVYSGNKEAADKFTADNQTFAAQFTLYRCDISKEDEVIALFAELQNSYPRLDILINNAGIRQDAMLALMDLEKWSRVIDVNLTGTYLMSKQAVLFMMQNKYGRIISITSPVARLGFSGQANYAASKAGQIAMTKTLAKEVARKKITVNCVSPGFIATDFIEDLPKEQLAEYKKLVPMRRFGSVDDVANAVLFLAGKNSAYISGATLEVTGGL